VVVVAERLAEPDHQGHDQQEHADPQPYAPEHETQEERSRAERDEDRRGGAAGHVHGRRRDGLQAGRRTPARADRRELAQREQGPREEQQPEPDRDEGDQRLPVGRDEDRGDTEQGVDEGLR
jgi:hypothetical protein